MRKTFLIVSFYLGSLCAGTAESNPLLQMASVGPEYLVQANSHIDGKEYISRIVTADLKDTPKWVDTENPPLSAKKAESLARPVAMQLAKKQFANYEMDCITIGRIRTLEMWYYEVTYMNPNVDISKIQSSGNPLNTICILVLMNGRAIEPKLK